MYLIPMQGSFASLRMTFANFYIVIPGQHTSRGRSRETGARWICARCLGDGQMKARKRLNGAKQPVIVNAKRARNECPFLNTSAATAVRNLRRSWPLLGPA